MQPWTAKKGSRCSELLENPQRKQTRVFVQWLNSICIKGKGGDVGKLVSNLSWSSYGIKRVVVKDKIHELHRFLPDTLMGLTVWDYYWLRTHMDAEAKMLQLFCCAPGRLLHPARPDPHSPVVDSTVLAKNSDEVKSQFQFTEALLRMDTP